MPVLVQIGVFLVLVFGGIPFLLILALGLCGYDFNKPADPDDGPRNYGNPNE